MLCVHSAFICHQIPSAIGALRGGEDFAMGLNMRPSHSGGLSIGMGCARWVEMPIKRIIKPADDPLNIGHRGYFCDLVRADDLCL